MKAGITPTLFWIGGGIFLLYALVNGWRRGIVRQAVNIVAVIAGYFTGLFGGRLLLPLVRSLGYPDLAISIVVGAILGFVVYIGISALGAILFKKTSQQDVMLVRWGFGLGGAFLGAGFGLFLLWFSLIALRLLGTVAETELKVAQGPKVRDYHDPGPIVRGLVDAKQSLETGPAGGFVEKLDPLPGRIYSIMSKTTRVLSSESGGRRFMEFAGVKKLSENPKVRSLLSDPDIIRDARARNYLAMIKNPKLVSVLNDPEVMEMVKRVELEKALDYALKE